jgi:hypothetical protein
MTKKSPEFSAQTMRLGRECYFLAKEVVGPLWQHFSREMRWAFVSEQILSLLRQQDESVSDARVRAMMNDVTEFCRHCTFEE